MPVEDDTGELYYNPLLDDGEGSASIAADSSNPLDSTWQDTLSNVWDSVKQSGQDILNKTINDVITNVAGNSAPGGGSNGSGTVVQQVNGSPAGTNTTVQQTSTNSAPVANKSDHAVVIAIVLVIAAVALM